MSGCSNRLEALALFKNKPENYDLIITDITMTEMTGNKLAKEIKRTRFLFPLPNAPVSAKKSHQEPHINLTLMRF